jgi:hypothetical protein
MAAQETCMLNVTDALLVIYNPAQSKQKYKGP